MRRSLLLAAVTNLTLLLGCASEETDGQTSGGGGQGPNDPPVLPTFESRLCHDGLCWLAPAPQGNQLRDASTSPAGTTFGVGDNGAIVRWSSSGFEAMGLPADYPTLLSVHALADDDVWFVGEQGTVLHLGSELASRPPENASETDTYVAVRAFEGGQGWLVSRQGGVFRLQDGAWTRSFSAVANNQSVSLLGMWAPSADEAWVLGRLGEEPHLFRFDGAAWSEVPVTLEPPVDELPAGAPVGVTGLGPGAAQIAFDQRVLEVGPDGASTTLYAGVFDGSFMPSPIVDVRADASGQTLAALQSGEVVALSGSEKSFLSTSAQELGEGPGGRLLLLRASGAIGDPFAPGADRRAIDPLVVPLGSSASRCAPAGSGAVCLLESASGTSQLWRLSKDDASKLVKDLGELVDARVFANATGTVALAQYDTVRVFDAAGERSVSVGQTEVQDVAVSDDGTVYVVGLSGTFSKLAPGATVLSTIPYTGGPAAEDQTVRSLHRAGPNTIYFAAIKFVNQDQDVAVVVRSADGALMHDAVAPFLYEYPVPVITESGVPYIEGLAKDYGEHAIFRLDGTSWTRLDLAAGPNTELSAFGETVVVRNPDDGSSITLIEAGGVRALKLPASSLTSVVPSEAGLFGVTEHVDSAIPGFGGYGGLGLFFAAAQ